MVWVCLLNRFSRVWLFCDPMDCNLPGHSVHSRQEYWNGFPRPSPGNLPNPGTELRSPVLQAVSLLSEPPGKPMEFWNTLKMAQLRKDADSSLMLIKKWTAVNRYSMIYLQMVELIQVTEKTWHGLVYQSQIPESVNPRKIRFFIFQTLRTVNCI